MPKGDDTETKKEVSGIKKKLASFRMESSQLLL